MKEDTFKTDSQAGKYRINSPRMKNKSTGFAESAVNALDSTTTSGYGTTAKVMSESATELLNLAGDNAKKAYNFISKYKYQTLGVLGAAGIAGAGYIWLSKRNGSMKSALPTLAKAKKMISKGSKAKRASKKR